MTTTARPTPALDTVSLGGMSLSNSVEEASSWAAGFLAGLQFAAYLPEPAMDLLQASVAEYGNPCLNYDTAVGFYAEFIKARREARP